MVVFGDFVKFKNKDGGWVVVLPDQDNFTLGVLESSQSNPNNAGIFRILDENGNSSGKTIKTDENVLISATIGKTNYFLRSSNNSCAQPYFTTQPPTFTNVFRWKLYTSENIVINNKLVKIRFSPSQELAFSRNSMCNGKKVNFVLEKNSISLGHYFQITKLAPSPLYPIPQPLNPQPIPYNPIPQPLNPLPIPYNPIPQPLNPQPIPYNPIPQPLNPLPIPYNPVPQPLNPHPLIPLNPEEKCKWYENNENGKCAFNKFFIAIGVVVMLLVILIAVSQIKK